MNRKAGEFASVIGAVLCDRDRGVFRVVIGAIKARPIVVNDGAKLINASGGIDTAALWTLLDKAQVTNVAKRHQSVAAVLRAHAQAVSS